MRLKACPTGAIRVDTENGNVRILDETLCDGCRLRIDACPHKPSRIIWNPERNAAAKCDLFR